jgi:SAM-dependent methyltransferase
MQKTHPMIIGESGLGSSASNLLAFSVKTKVLKLSLAVIVFEKHNILALRLRKILRRLRYEIIDAPRGRGRGWPSAVWDAQFARGDWDQLYSVGQVGHYMIIVGYVLHYGGPTPLILDAGCGQGRLLSILKLCRLKDYLGVDISPKAIELARSLAVENSRFVVANFEEWEPDSRFDLVIFNESLYYAKDPCKVLRSFQPGLTESGKFIVSLHHYGNHRAIWRDIESKYSVLSAFTVTNDQKRWRWTVKVLNKPKAESKAQQAVSRIGDVTEI